MPVVDWPGLNPWNVLLSVVELAAHFNFGHFNFNYGATTWVDILSWCNGDEVDYNLHYKSYF